MKLHIILKCGNKAFLERITGAVTAKVMQSNPKNIMKTIKNTGIETEFLIEGKDMKKEYQKLDAFWKQSKRMFRMVGLEVTQRLEK